MEKDKTKRLLVMEASSLRSRIAAFEALKNRYIPTLESLGEEAARYRAMVEAFEGLVYISGEDLRIEYMNRRFIERKGYDGTGGICYRVIYGRESVCPWCVKDRVFKGDTVRWEIRSPLDNRWYYVVDAPIYKRDGSISKQAMILDIDDLKRREAAVKEREKKYRSLFDDSMDAICITDREGRFQEFNKAAELLVGYSREELLKDVTADSLFVDKQEMGYFRGLLEERGVLKDFQAKLRKKDGTVMRCLLSASLKRGDKGEVIGYQGVIRDVTRQMETEEALVENEKRTRLFAYSISHDLKNPALAVHGIARRLLKELRGGTDIKAATYAELIVSASEQILRLADQINAFITTKVAPLNPEVTNMVEIARLLEEEFAGRLRGKGVSMIYREDLPEVYADRISLMRILRNLVDNALKYGGEGMKEIALDCVLSGEYCLISVRDDGVTIPEGELRAIFEPFRRLGNKGSPAGTGLGLGIVKELAERHGGSAWVEAHPAKGKTFFVSIRRKP
jgi:PAS domain S-box-containing protein